MAPPGKGKYVNVPLDSNFPPGWRKEVYKLNGKLHPKWSIWRDPSGKKYFKEAAVMAKLSAGSKPPVLRDISIKETQGDNMKKEKASACHLCGKTFYQRNNVKRHLENVHNIFTEILNTSDSKLPTEKENEPKKQVSKNVINPPKAKILHKRNSKGMTLSRLKEKKIKKRTAQKIKETISMDELEITAHCDICEKGFKGRCGQSNMERHRRNVHGLLTNKTGMMEQTEQQTEELTELDIATDFYNKIILKLL